VAALVCLTDRRGSHLATLLRREGFHIYQTYTPDHAVCLCVQHFVNAVILDEELFVETNGWSIAQSVKGVRPSVSVILVTNAEVLGGQKPKGVDFIVGKDDLSGLRRALETATRGYKIRPRTSVESETIQ